MSLLDWSLLVLYSIGLIAMSIYLGKGQESQEDYYVGGRSLPWWAVGISTMATQMSAISFISIPAFVALKPGGGLKYLQWEFPVPLAMVFIMIFLLPFFRKLELISVYEYLEKRFNSAVRALLSIVFMISRTAATGVAVFAVAVVLSVVLKLDPFYTVLIIGIVTVIYDTIGGMKAVVYSDVIQMLILVLGLGTAVVYGIKMAGGWGGVLEFLRAHPDRALAVDFSHWGLGDGNEYNFWAAMIGLFFLAASYYGCDQTQTQRELSAPDIKEVKLSLAFNAFARIIVVSAYILMGIALGSALFNHPHFQEVMSPYLEAKKYDYLVPVFVYHYMPIGIKGLIFAAILAAAMSSLDSAINSLSAVFMRDFYEKYINPNPKSEQILKISKISTATIGAITVAIALMLTKMKGLRTVVELINQIGSVFYGPILATFLMGVLTRKTNPIGMIIGIISGVLFNLGLWLFAPGVSWLWWNFFGCAVTCIVSYLVSLATKPYDEERTKGLVLWDTNLLAEEKKWIPVYILIGIYTLGMILIGVAISKTLAGML